MGNLKKRNRGRAGGVVCFLSREDRGSKKAPQEKEKSGQKGGTGGRCARKRDQGTSTMSNWAE